MADGTCEVEDCDRPARTRNKCNTHYSQWWKQADPSELKYRRGQPKPPCLIEGCGKPRKAKGYCDNHYRRLRLYDDPLGGHYENTGHIVASSGYVKVWEPEHPLASADGYVLEHRKVVFDAGIAIPAGHHVHHLNHDKKDNRLENLEVLPEGEHHRQHVREQGFVVNQFGTWPLRNV